MPDILIIGGGIIGVSIALELRLRGATVTVLTRDRLNAATRAAGGMLAPHAEQLPPGMLLDLGLKSLSLYPDWIQRIEERSGCNTGYWPSGILAPIYQDDQATVRQRTEQDALHSSKPVVSRRDTSHSFSEPSLSAQWLDQATIHQTQPGLGAEVIGGWWYPDDGQVDNRKLFDALWKAAEGAGVRLKEVTVEAIQQRQGNVTGVRTTSDTYEAGHYILAAGAWSSNLLPIPMQPIKGQMMSVTGPTHDLVPSHRYALRRVLFGKESYIIPRQDGRILVGATVEPVGFTPYNTPAGLQTLLNAAIRLYPALKDYPVNEYWWGFRPTTSDESPILGPSHCENLTIATGHHRNGILLAPATALLIADWVWNKASSHLLSAFSWKRFGFSQVLSDAYPALPTDAERGVSDPTHDDPPNPELTTLPVTRAHSRSTNIDLTSSPSRPMQTLHSSSIHPESSQSPAQAIAYPSVSDDNDTLHDAPLTIAGRTFESRLMTGTGKYRNFDQMHGAIAASRCQIVTVAVRRVQTQAPGHEGLAEALNWTKLWMLPNTAGCKTAEEAIRVARLGREMAKLLGQEDNNFVKIEVIPDTTYLLPDPIGTLEAAEQLVKEGFAVLPYINADPLLAKRLEEAGCATVMPLGSPIGSGQGIRNAANIQIIIENATIPVVVDAGIGTPSEAAQAMEMGADALLINTAIAQAADPGRMGRAMCLAAEAGRLACLAGRIPIRQSASASSPLTGTISS